MIGTGVSQLSAHPRLLGEVAELLEWVAADSAGRVPAAHQRQHGPVMYPLELESQSRIQTHRRKQEAGPPGCGLPGM